MTATHPLLLGFVLVSLACTGAAGDRSEQTASSAAQGTSGQMDSISALIERLRTASGRFVELPTRLWELQGVDSLLEAFAPFRDSAVVRLVDCLDRTEPTAMTVGGRPVLLGALCFEALTHIAYAEPEGSETGEWPGVVFPDAAGPQLTAAKSAWAAVVRSRGYRFN